MINNEKIKKKIVEKFRNLKKIKGNAHYIAIGMAVGVFVSATPTIPFHTILALIIATFIKGSRTAAAIGVWFSNPFTVIQIYLYNYKIGVLVTGSKKVFNVHNSSIFEMLKIGIDITFIMIIGGIILGFFLFIITYFLIRLVFIFVNNKN